MLTDRDREHYGWQIPVDGFGEAGQARLKASSVLVTRCGGVGGVVAMELAAAGVGRLVLAHAGPLRLDDMNRQVLMDAGRLGESRVEIAADGVRRINPDIQVVPVAENLSSENAGRLVGMVDLVVDCAPLFEERFALNRAAVLGRKPMVEAAVYGLEGHLTTFLPGKTGCLRCLYPEFPETWRRRFPVFGAVSAVYGGLAAMEAVKVLSGFGATLAGTFLTFDLRDMSSRRYTLRRCSNCPDCGALYASGGALA